MPIMVAVVPIAGHLASMLPVVSEFVHAGHDVQVYAGAAYREDILSSGDGGLAGTTPRTLTGTTSPPSSRRWPGARAPGSSWQILSMSSSAQVPGNTGTLPMRGIFALLTRPLHRA